MTEGILINEFLRFKNFNNYSVIIIDEAHEWGLNCDILLGILK